MGTILQWQDRQELQLSAMAVGSGQDKDWVRRVAGENLSRTYGLAQAGLWPSYSMAQAGVEGGSLKSSTRGKEGQPWLRILLTFFTAAFSRVTSCAPSWPCAQIAKAAGGRICLGSCQAALFSLKSFKASEGEKRV